MWLAIAIQRGLDIDMRRLEMAPGMMKCKECEKYISLDEISYGHDCEESESANGQGKDEWPNDTNNI